MFHKMRRLPNSGFFPETFAFLLDVWYKYTNPKLDFLEATYQWKRLEKDPKPELGRGESVVVENEDGQVE